VKDKSKGPIYINGIHVIIVAVVDVVVFVVTAVVLKNTLTQKLILTQ